MADRNQVPSQSFTPRLLPDEYSFAAAGVIGGVLHSLRNNLSGGSLFVDQYWIGFYVTNFQDGFRRRALIGTLCRVLFPHGVSVIAINILSFIVAFVLIGLLMRAFVRLSAAASLRVSLFTFAFFASTLASGFIETAGDTLQIAFVVFLGVLFVFAKLIKSETLRLIAGLVLIVIGFMIHEASMFFLVPALPFLLRSRPRIVDFLAPSLLLFALIVLSVHWSQLQPNLTYRAIPFPHNRVLTEPIATPSFRQLLHTETAFDFGSVHNIIRFGSRCLRLVVLLFAGVVAMSHCLPRRVFERFLLPFFALSLYNAPLWFIAHDWGRFLAYIFFYAIIVTAALPETASSAGDSLLSRISEWFRSAGTLHPISFAVLFVLFTSHTLFSRVTGMHVRTLITFTAMMMFAAFGSLARPQRLEARL